MTAPTPNPLLSAIADGLLADLHSTNARLDAVNRERVKSALLFGADHPELARAEARDMEATR